MSADTPNPNPAPEPTASEHAAVRLEKLRKIEALGIDPWGARFDGHQSIASIRELDAQPFDDTKPEANAPSPRPAP